VSPDAAPQVDLEVEVDHFEVEVDPSDSVDLAPSLEI
jgi:hypothetical protein